MAKRIIMERPVKRGETEAFDREFWRKAGHESRFAAAAEMVVESRLFRGQDADESRFQRSFECLKRRER